MLVVTASCAFSSHLHILVLALQRYLAIVFPFRYETWVTRRRLRVTMALMWTVSLGYGFTCLSWGWEGGSESCGTQIYDANTTVSQLPVFALVILMLLVTYCSIFRIARQKTSKVASTATSPDTTPTNSSETGQQLGAPHLQARDQQKSKLHRGMGKAPKFMIATISTYLATWSVYFCVDIIEMIRPEFQRDEVWFLIEYTALLLAFANSSANILIYSCYALEFKQAYRKLLCGCLNTNTN